MSIASTDFRSLVQRTSYASTPTFVVLAATLCIVVPASGALPAPAILGLHYFGIALLGLFLLVGGVCQLLSRACLRQGSVVPVGSYRLWWAATFLAPAPAAFCILLSGIRLVYDSADHGRLSHGWLFWLVCGFSFFFFDGLLFYLPVVSRRFRAIEASKSGERPKLESGVFDMAHEWMLLLHVLAFPIVLALGWTQPANLWSPALLIQDHWDHYLRFPSPVVRVTYVLMLIALVGVALLLLRLPPLIGRRDRRRAAPPS